MTPTPLARPDPAREVGGAQEDVGEAGVLERSGAKRLEVGADATDLALGNAGLEPHWSALSANSSGGRYQHPDEARRVGR